jgi:hypothetical protein
MMNIFRLAPDPAPHDRLLPREFAYLTAQLGAARLNWAGAEPQLRLARLRSTYEPQLHAISQYLLLPLPGWSPSPAPDNWQGGEDGGLARELIDSGRPGG